MVKWESFLFIIFMASCLPGYSQSRAKESATGGENTVQTGRDLPFIEGGHFKQGTHVDPRGRGLGLNNHHLRYDGKPILPVMGEIHYTRYPEGEWEEALLKMKAGGIGVIALYCFWIHHEEEKGNIRFDGNRNVRRFIELCAKHRLWAFVRIGPWCHGEARNGGFPDWFAKQRGNAWDRGYEGRLDPAVEKWYNALAGQFKGLAYKDGGPIIGLQVDNEVHSEGPGHLGYRYMSDLRNLALAAGMDLPLYTATGWPGPVLPEDLLMPLYGAYPEAPWEQHARKLTPPIGYFFTADRKDKAIGIDPGFGGVGESKVPVYRHPLLTVEMGGGNQITYHRRPRLEGKDMLALVYTRLGVGANMIGYYVFHGTQHPLSWHDEYPTQESKITVHPYPNDYPMISYDFEAPLTEWGFMRDYYHDFKLIHHFINDFGSDLAPMQALIPDGNSADPADSLSLRWSIRSRGGRGYIFFNNYVRQVNTAAHRNVRFKIQLEKETLTVPDGGIDIPAGAYGILPFNTDMQGVLLKYSTAHPFMILNHSEKCYFFYAINGIVPEFTFQNSTVKKITVRGGRAVSIGDRITVRNLKPGKECRMEITAASGGRFAVFLLSEDEARCSYQFTFGGRETILMTDKMAFYDEKKKELELRSLGVPEFDFYAWPRPDFASASVVQNGKAGYFCAYRAVLPPCKTPEIKFREISRRADFDAYCRSLGGKTPAGPTYSHRVDPDAPYLAYELDLPESIPEGANDMLLEFDYRGNTAQVYAGGRIIADDFYSGSKMPFALRRHREALPKSRFLFQITPMMPKHDIYFEEGTDLEFAENLHAALKGVSVIPEYSVKIRIK